jgi:hypothetical protein
VSPGTGQRQVEFTIQESVEPGFDRQIDQHHVELGRTLTEGVDTPFQAGGQAGGAADAYGRHDLPGRDLYLAGRGERLACRFEHPLPGRGEPDPPG